LGRAAEQKPPEKIDSQHKTSAWGKESLAKRTFFSSLLDLEASYHQDFGRDSDYSLHYLPKPPNTILVFVHYKSETSAETLDKAIDTAKQLVNQDASAHRWSSWVKVEVQRKLIKK